MFTHSARFYDAIYSFKDYEREAAQVHGFIGQYCRSGGGALLDVACGTGQHLIYLQGWYQAEGLDLDENMLRIARERMPDLPFHHASMVDFKLDRRFDAIACLFSAIGYVKTEARLRQAIATMAGHLRPGGVLLVEPWHGPEAWEVGSLRWLTIDQPDLKIARMSISQREDDVAVLVFHYLVGTPQAIDYFTERHELGLFTHQHYLDAFQTAGLDVVFDPEGLMGRGMYIGRLISEEKRNDDTAN